MGQMSAVVRAVLAELVPTRLATVHADGRPHVVPLWFLAEDGHVDVTTDTDKAKVRHAEPTPGSPRWSTSRRVGLRPRGEVWQVSPTSRETRQ
jgi:hypothetical protein